MGDSRSSEKEGIQRAIIEVTEEILHELYPRNPRLAIDLDSRLDTDLGIDSLGRAQILTRLEVRLGMGLPEEKILTARTLRDVFEATQAPPSKSHSSIAAIPLPQEKTLKKNQPPAFTAQSVVDLLCFHASQSPNEPYLDLLGEDDAVQVFSYAEVLRHAEVLGAGLQKRLSLKNQTVAIMLPTGIDFFAAFFGILLSGHIPVPLYPPFRWGDIEEHLRRQTHILKNADCPILITHPDALKLKNILTGLCPSLKDVATVDTLSHERSSLARATPQPQDIAFLQYTSGSTGDPKGVVLTHQNLLANIRAMGTAAAVRPGEIFVSWLPLYHDMGLIGAFLGTLYYGCRLVLMSPLTFLARPEKWLWTIHRYRGTLSASPNFGYERCLHSIPEEKLKGLDLSSWRVAFNGAEPVHAKTIERFTSRFKAYGFGETVLTPVYGLAESSVGLAFPPLNRPAKIDLIDRTLLYGKGWASPTLPDSPESLPIVSGGLPLAGHEIRILDEGGRELPERREGKIHFKGPSATSGYFRNSEATAKLFRGSWLNSGDRGYIADGEIFITGREKDLIIRGGRNLYPYELEDAVGNLPGLRKGCVAVFGVNDPRSATERIVVAAEKKENSTESDAPLRERINELAVTILESPPDEILLLAPHTIPKTSSGKIRRSYCKELYERGRLGLSLTPFRQILDLTLKSIGTKTLALLSHAVDLLYGAFSYFMGAIFTPILAFGLLILPNYKRRLAFARFLARLFFKLIALPVTVRGATSVPEDRPVVLVSNHQSYLDWLILIAYAPGFFHFIAKGEFQKISFFRFWMGVMEVFYVDRVNPRKGLEDMDFIRKRVEEGIHVLFFPEGTFELPPGLFPFRLGAFQVAAGANAPILPLVIRGTRQAYPAYHWMLKRRPISLTILEPVLARGNSWNHVLELREKVYNQVLAHCGEGPLPAPTGGKS